MRMAFKEISVGKWQVPALGRMEYDNRTLEIMTRSEAVRQHFQGRMDHDFTAMNPTFWVGLNPTTINGLFKVIHIDDQGITLKHE